MKEPVLEMAFAGGIDQSQRSELLDPRAAFVALENVRAPSIGAVAKRDGFDTHAGGDRVDGTSRTAGYRQFAHGKLTCFIDRDVGDVFSTTNDEQITRGRVPECGLSMMKVPAPGVPGSLTCTDSVRVGDFLALAYTAGQSVYASVIEAATGQVVLAPTLIYTGSAAEIYGLLGARGSTAMLFIICSGEAAIQMSECDCSSATGAHTGWSSATPAVSDGAGVLALAVHSIGTRVYLAYANNDVGTDRLTVKVYDGGAGASVDITTNGVTPVAVALGGVAGDPLWVAWNETTTVYGQGLNTTTLATTAAASGLVLAGATPSYSGVAVVASSTAAQARVFVNDGGDRLLMRNFLNNAGTVTTSGSTVTTFNVQMSGRPFRVGSRYYGVCQGSDTTEDVAILCDLSEANAWVRPIANIAPRLASSYPQAQAAQHLTREFWAPIGVQTAGNVTGVQMAKFDFDADARWRPVAHNGVTFLSGGLVTYFDGARFAESNFVIRPPAPVPTDSGSGAGLTGVYRYIAVYEQIDAAGNWHVSGVSAVGTSAAITDNAMSVVVRNLGISARISAATDPSVRISIYRTVAGGSVYYYLTSLTNTLSSETQTYTDSTTDATLEARALFMSTGALSNTGAQLDRRAVQGLAHLCAYNGFLVGANGEEIFWTGQDVDGEGSWWNDNFSLAISGGGDVTALDTLEGVLYAFKRDRIFVLAGQPPTDNGADGGLGAPQRLAVSIGARSPFTCATELGIFFVSDRGIELLNRNRGVDFIGEKVQDTFAAYPYVSAMTYDARSSCVLIECSAGRSAGLPTGSGRTLVYDLKARVWRSVDRRANSAGTADAPAADGCIVWDGSAYRYAWLGTEGRSYVETSEHSLNPDDSRVRMYAKTGEVHLSGIQGEQIIDGVLLLGEHVDDHDLTVGIANDYSDTFAAQTRDSDALAAMTLYNPHFDVDQKTGQSIAVELYDGAPTGDADEDDAGAIWVALTFIGAAKSGGKRTSAVLRGGE